MLGHKGNVNSVGVSADKNLLVTGACDKLVKVWDLRDAKKPARTFIGHTGDINSVSFFPDATAVGMTLLACSTMVS